MDGYEMTCGEGANGGQRNLLFELKLDPEADAAEAERLGRQLRNDLTQLDVDAVKPATTVDVPEGAKRAKGAAVDWGSLLVTFSAAGGVFTSLIVVAQDWLARHSSAQSISLTIDNDTIVLDRASAGEREQLISTWVHRHSRE